MKNCDNPGCPVHDDEPHRRHRQTLNLGDLAALVILAASVLYLAAALIAAGTL